MCYHKNVLMTFFVAIGVAISANASADGVTPAIKAFSDICLKTAPSFANAQKASAAFGVTSFDDLEGMKMGMTSDGSLGVQITGDKECVITIEAQKDSTLTLQFIQAVSETLGMTPAKQVPFRAKIGQSMFIFQHDREGGEAFVMLKQ